MARGEWTLVPYLVLAPGFHPRSQCRFYCLYPQHRTLRIRKAGASHYIRPEALAQ
ncbi:hypothetical protein LEMLEM_LOCUS20621 [Lemmus lemmus]